MSAPQRLHSVDQIVDMMRARIDELVREVWGLRDGHAERNDFVCRSPLRADRNAGSFRIAVRGPYRGMVKDFASGETWTPLSFTAALLFRGDNSEALRWARAWLGLDGTDPESFRKTRVAVEQVAAEPDDDGGQGDRYRAVAHRRYLEACESILDTPVDAYLRGRGLDVRRLPFTLRALRFHPALRCTEAGRDFPAMVAPVVAADGRFLALHRTWLEVQRDGRVVKVPGLKEPKKALGSGRGGTIRLWNGTRVDPQTGEIKKARKLADEKAGVWIDLTEGIEDGLSVAIAMEELRVHVGVSVSWMQAIRLPAQVEGVAIWQQNDAPDSSAARGVGKVIENFRSQGKRVRLVRPPEGFKDANEWVQAMNQRQQEAG
ncbi:hypothetical protein AZL_025520 [Azospirillum sp. B510]|uniref:DUF7146 domain-containing protein n=1 Tax=Azospirillum sp. (strain B510) TaxID=137722 RepID=UPI0001C4CBF6|nr:toprim domain-containing protein [Azospirillum sp. B510]BAI73190.1 hypothetical protein AZL_025520 [Azospirillum sp. B510]